MTPALLRAALEALAGFTATVLLLCAPVWIAGWLVAVFGGGS